MCRTFTFCISTKPGIAFKKVGGLTIGATGGRPIVSIGRNGLTTPVEGMSISGMSTNGGLITSGTAGIEISTGMDGVGNGTGSGDGVGAGVVGAGCGCGVVGIGGNGAGITVGFGCVCGTWGIVGG